MPRTGSAGPDEDLPLLLSNFDSRMRTALAVGSVSLYEALERAKGSVDKGSRLASKLLRYLIRMLTRPTPYGLFAGVALAHWGPVTDLSLARTPPQTHSRPDMEWLLNLVFQLESRPAVRAKLSYRANPRAFVHAGRVFLPERAPTAGSADHAQAVSVQASRAVCLALALASKPIPHDCLVEELSTTPGATADKIEALIEGLWHQTFLLTDLRPPLSVHRPAAYVAHRMRGIPAAAVALEQLEMALSATAAWDELPAERAASAYLMMARPTEGKGEVPAQMPPQVDTTLSLNGRHIAEAVAREAARAAELLIRLTPLPNGPPHLAAYRAAFHARYGQDREVPLLELLDPNVGIGAPPTHLHGAAPGSDLRQAELRHRTLRDLAVTALRERQLVVDLDHQTLSQLESWSPSASQAPPSLDLSLFVVTASAAELDKGRFLLVVGPNLGATGAGRNLGRFADILGAEARVALEEVSRRESARRPDALWAELVYLPRRLRSANVVVRPHYRPFEIVLGTTPGLPPDRVIPLDALVVGVHENRFYARWPARDAEVVACAGHMLNNAQAPDAFRFLEDIRRDGLAQFMPFDWGPAAGFPILPRIQVGRIVLCLAQWRIDVRTSQVLFAESQQAFKSSLAAWRERWQVPRYVYLASGDNRLLLDLENNAQAEELRAEVRQLTDDAQVSLQEALPAPGQTWLDGPGGRFVTELMVPIVLRTKATSSGHAPWLPPAAATSPPAAADRLRAPGSDWLFAKLYCPRPLEEDILTGPIADFCQQSIATSTADDWFFIRYSDPEAHLRLRFRGHPERLIRVLLPQLCSWAAELITEGRCTRLCFDTYEREVERYGGPAATEAAEAIFGADSRAVVEALRLSREGLLAIDITSLAVLSIDDLLASLGATEAERLEWYREQMISRNTVGEEYRRRQGTLRLLLGDIGQVRQHQGGDALARILAARREELAPVSRRLHTLAEAGLLSQRRSALWRSYVHLHCNRLLAGDWSAEQQVLNLLARTRYGLVQAPLSHRQRG